MESKIKRERNSVTKQKIIDILIDRKSALAHKDFYDVLRNDCDRVTVYRALDRLVEEGKIHKVTGMEGVVQYALCSECSSGDHHHDNHVHFHCTSCDKVVCIENSKPQLNLPDGYNVQEVQCLVTGTCPHCK